MPSEDSIGGKYYYKSAASHQLQKRSVIWKYKVRITKFLGNSL